LKTNGKEIAISIKWRELPEKAREILQESVPWSCLINFSEYTALFFLVCLA
jgi:hypothetical protein